jgi:hypothetical protein
LSEKLSKWSSFNGGRRWVVCLTESLESGSLRITTAVSKDLTFGIEIQII